MACNSGFVCVCLNFVTQRILVRQVGLADYNHYSDYSIEVDGNNNLIIVETNGGHWSYPLNLPTPHGPNDCTCTGVNMVATCLHPGRHSYYKLNANVSRDPATEVYFNERAIKKLPNGKFQFDTSLNITRGGIFKSYSLNSDAAKVPPYVGIIVQLTHDDFVSENFLM